MHHEFSHRQGAEGRAIDAELERTFVAPGAEYAPSAFWFWNGKEELSEPAHFARLAEEMSKQGLNPGFVHARFFQSQVPFWLSDDWYECFAAALQATEQCGTKMTYTMGDPSFPDKYLLASHYDYPNFPVGGMSLKDHPELRAVSLDYHVMNLEAAASCEIGEHFFAVAAQINPSGQLLSSTLHIIGTGSAVKWQAPAGGNWRVYVFSKMYEFTSQFKINFLDRRLAEPWLRLENTEYEKRFAGHFGKTMPGVFFDLEGFFGYKIAWSDDLAQEYLQATGTDIRVRMPLLLEEDAEGLWPKARYDWFTAAASLYEECVFIPLDHWCRSKQMYATCHFWEESLFLQATRVADFMRMQRSLSMPGTDALFHTIHEPRYFKESQSVSEFEGRQLMCEAFGIIGWDVTPAELKKGANSAVAMGITQLVPHGINSRRDLRGVSYPPDFFDWNPYWRQFHLWTDFVRRASFVNDQGRLDAHVLIYCPLESVYALVGGGYFDPRQTGKDIWAEADQMNIPRIREIEEIEQAYTQAIQDLYDERIDSLIADRHYLDRMTVLGKQLRLGEFLFDTLILPPLRLFSLAAARKIAAFAGAGGNVYALGSLPEFSAEQGTDGGELRQLMDLLRSAPTFQQAQTGLKPLIASCAAGLEPGVTFEEGAFALIASRRKVGDKSFIWLANNTGKHQDCVLRISNVTGGAAIWNCEDGTTHTIPTMQTTDGVRRVKLGLGAYDGCWLVFDPQNPQGNAKREDSAAEAQEIRVAWTVCVNPAAQQNLAQHQCNAPEWLLGGKEQRPLESWLKWGLRSFSGFVDYEADITLEQVSGHEELDLGEVKHIAEVYVNGELAGERMWGPFVFKVGKYLQPGKNRLHVRIGNLLLNAVTQYEDYKWKWFQPPEDKQLDCGWFGPVTIKR